MLVAVRSFEHHDDARRQGVSRPSPSKERARLIRRVFPVVLLLLLILIPLHHVAPTSVRAAIPTTDNDKGESDKGKDKDDKEDDKEEKKEEKDNDKEQKDQDKKDKKQVESVAPYTVTVVCSANPSSDSSSCTFTGQAPAGAKPVERLIVSPDELCGEVVGGDADVAKTDPKTHVSGYASRGKEGRFTLEFSGSVTVGGTATYWFKTGPTVVPARGPGLICEDSQPTPTATSNTLDLTPLPATTEPPSTPTPTPVPDVSDSTGAVRVETYVCAADVSASAPDWFGLCDPNSTSRNFRLAPVGDDGQPTTTGTAASTDDQGQVQFGALAPGDYELTLEDQQWCHAESDGVDDQGHLNVRAGERVTVWIFSCEDTVAK